MDPLTTSAFDLAGHPHKAEPALLAQDDVHFAAIARSLAESKADLSDRIDNPDRREEEQERLMKRFEKLGTQIMHRSGGSMLNDDGVSGVLADRGKQQLAAALIGQSFVIAYNTIRHNREGTDYVASRLVAAGELYGDDVVQLLEDARLERPDIDLLDEDAWPVI